ncbi:hypothetical protein F442_14144 [Phytophthora nicotianae P10297]|uniref:Uncharacterized protein n=1 Tax=Phytophthora nicotianae P10297 TaxID=1317064 RepID=W2YTE8_PHYNI|nr:hypothetical protein F442_14144 [Phytophthora nicotianae P10297]
MASMPRQDAGTGYYFANLRVWDGHFSRSESRSFKGACMQHEHTDRASAIAEVISEKSWRLQEKWLDLVWCMWGNHITRNLNRSTWEIAIEKPPPRYIENLRRPADSPLEQHLSNITQSANMALDCGRGSLADYQQHRRDWEAFGRRLHEHERHLETRKNIIEDSLLDVAPPSPSLV